MRIGRPRGGRLPDAQDRGGGGGGQRPGRDPAGAAGRLGHLALPDGLGRRRLLGQRGGGQGGPRGDRDRVRGGAPDRRARRAAPPLHEHPALLARVPLPGHRRRPGRPPARDPRAWAGSPRTTLPEPLAGRRAVGRAGLRRHPGRAVEVLYDDHATRPGDRTERGHDAAPPLRATGDQTTDEQGERMADEMPSMVEAAARHRPARLHGQRAARALRRPRSRRATTQLNAFVHLDLDGGPGRGGRASTPASPRASPSGRWPACPSG